MKLNLLSRSLRWFDQKFSTKESLQSLVVIAFILLVIGTKCYILIVPQPQQQKPEPAQTAISIFDKPVGK